MIETQRGDHLGEVIREGSAIPNTGIPGNIGGYTVERLLKASADGIMHPVARIGDVVKKGRLLQGAEMNLSMRGSTGLSVGCSRKVYRSKRIEDRRCGCKDRGKTLLYDFG